MQRVWLQVALAAVAGLGSLAVCSGAVAVLFLLFISSLDFGIGSILNPAFFLAGVLAAMIFAWASLALPPLAFGARGDHLPKTTLLSGLCFCGFMFGSFLSLATASFLVPLISLMALVGTPAIGSLVAIREEGPIAARTLRTTQISALAIYCASLFTYWLVYGESLSSILVPLIVAASSWPVLPAIVAMLRSG
jgi:hypothetical protein